jgi:hypothetical protein
MDKNITAPKIGSLRVSTKQNGDFIERGCSDFDSVLAASGDSVFK